MSGTPRQEVTLPGVPALPELYRQALVLAARRRVRRAAVPLDVPVVQHRVDGVRVALGSLTRFQEVLGSAARDAVPSAYVHTLAFPVAMSVLARPDFPLPLLGMVHLSNEVHQERRLDASETLDVVARAEHLRPHPAGTQVDVVIDVHVGDERVWTGRSVYLARGVRLDSAGPDGRRNEERPAFTAPTPTGVWRLAANTGRRYAAISGDWNPIHLSALSARALGMKAAIAHGMYLAARMVDEAVPAPSGALDWRIDFATPVLLPGSVTTSFARSGDHTGRRTDVVGWSSTRRRPHFTGWVRTE
ncbi:acyl dehydratase [Arthrobacter sp. CAN_A2]|uniref:MaoC family dehydratase n=1 Tax=Arthrobacter sp. CAN_A2 TaxID=2787718 RepID=UPI0018EFA539